MAEKKERVKEPVGPQSMGGETSENGQQESQKPANQLKNAGQNQAAQANSKDKKQPSVGALLLKKPEAASGGAEKA